MHLSNNLPASSSAKEMMNLWWWLISPGNEHVVVSPMQMLFSFQVPVPLSSCKAINRLRDNSQRTHRKPLVKSRIMIRSLSKSLIRSHRIHVTASILSQSAMELTQFIIHSLSIHN